MKYGEIKAYALYGYAVVLRALAGQPPETEESADKLGENRGEGGGADAEAEDGDKQQVQHNVDGGRHDQVNERVAAVPDGLQNAHKDIVHDKGEGTEKINTEVDRGLWQHIGGCPHPDKDAGSQDGARNGQKDARGKPESNRRVDGFLHFFYFLRAVIPGDDNSRAHGYSLKETDHQKNQVARRADGGERVAAKKVSNNQGIGGIVQLLKQISQKERERESDELLPDAALRQQGRFFCGCFAVHGASIFIRYKSPA